MPFQLTPARALQVESDRIQGLLELRQNNTVEWEEADFIAYLASIGLTYTNPQLIAIRAELLSRGVITVS